MNWPIGYADLAPYYDIVERYIGISGQAEGVPVLPDGVYLPPMPMTCAERALRDRVKARFNRLVTIGRTANLTVAHNGRASCHYCGPCERGCVTHSYFNATFTTVADAVKTGKCTLVTDAMVHQVLMDAGRHRATGIRYIDRNSRQVHQLHARAVVVCAQMFESMRILFNSATRQDPNGLGNSSGLLGKFLMVHFTDAGASADFPEFTDAATLGAPRRPTGIFVPRFRNLPGETRQAYLRGFGYQGQSSVSFSMGAPGYGEAYKRAVKIGVTRINLQGFGEHLPDQRNFVALDPQVVDAWGIPALRIHIAIRDNEKAMLQDMANAAAEMLEASGGTNIRTRRESAVGQPRSGVRAHGRGPGDLGSHAVPAAPRRRQRLRDGRVGLCVERLREPDADDDGAGRAIDGSSARADETGRTVVNRLRTGWAGSVGLVGLVGLAGWSGWSRTRRLARRRLSWPSPTSR